MSCHEHDTARQEVEGCLGPLEAAEELAQGRLVLQFLLDPHCTRHSHKPKVWPHPQSIAKKLKVAHLALRHAAHASVDGKGGQQGVLPLSPQLVRARFLQSLGEATFFVFPVKGLLGAADIHGEGEKELLCALAFHVDIDTQSRIEPYHKAFAHHAATAFGARNLPSQSSYEGEESEKTARSSTLLI